MRGTITGARPRRCRMAVTAGALALGLQTLLPAPAARAEGGTWVGTWSASPQPIWGEDFFAAAPIPRSVRDQTIRQVARISQGGDAVRVKFSNRYGAMPLVIGRAHVARAGEGGAIDAATDMALTFSGEESFTIPPGALAWSDPVALAVEDLSEIAVTTYFPEVTPLTTWHNDGRQTAYISVNGDFTGEESFEAAQTFDSRFFLSGIQVQTGDAPGSIVFLADSITDGDGSTPNENNRWPDVLAERLVEAGSSLTVLNEGISGARVLTDQLGVNALARFNDDVLAHPHVEAMVLMMGINDIGWPDSPLTASTEPAPSAEDIIAGYRQLIERAHMQGIRIFGATLTPFADTFAGGPLEGFYNEDKEAKRLAVNDWIRNGGAFDGVIDFDAVVRDPENPAHIRAEYDSGDHLHPNDAGYEAMANSVDLAIFGVAAN